MNTHRLWSLALTLGFTCLIGAFFALTPTPAWAVVRTWDGGGATNDWSEAANWSGDTQPGAADDAVFNATSTKASTVDAGFAGSVRSIQVTAGYTNTVTVSRSLAVGVGGVIIADGTLDATSQTITVSGGPWTHTAGGIWTAGTGTVSFTGAAATADVAGTETFNHLTIAKSAGVNQTIASGDTLVVNGTLTLTDGNMQTGTINATSTVSHGSAFDGGTGTLLLTGSASMTMTATGQLPILTMNGASVSVTGPASGTTQLDSVWNLTDGTFTGGAGVVTVVTNYAQTGGTFSGAAGNLDINGTFSLSSPGSFTAPSGTMFVGGNWTHTDASTFAHNSGTVTLDTGTATINVNTTELFYNLTLNKVATNTVVSSGDTLQVANTLTLVDGNINTGTVEGQATVTHGAAFDGGTGTLLLTGSATMTMTDTGQLPIFTMNGASVAVSGPATGTTTLDSTFNLQNGTFTAGAGALSITTNFTQTGGTFIGGASNMDINGAFALSSPGSFTAPSGTLFLGGNFTHTDASTYAHNSGTIVFDSLTTATINVNGTETFFNMSIAPPSSAVKNIASGDTVICAGTLTLTEGSLNGSSTTSFLEAQGTVIHGALFDGGTGRIILTGSATMAMTGGAQLPGLTLNGASVVVTGPTSGTVSFNRGFTMLAGTYNGGAGDLSMTPIDNFVISGGTFNGGSGNINLPSTGSGGSLTISGAGTTFVSTSGTLTFAGNWTHTDSSTFDPNGGTVVVNARSGFGVFDVNTTETFFNLTLNTQLSNTNITIPNSDTLIVPGTLTLTNGNITTGTVEAQGTVVHTAGFDGGTGTLELTGTATMTMVAGGELPAVTMQDAGVTVFGASSGTVGLNGTFTMNDGTFTGTAGNWDQFGGDNQGDLNVLGGTFTSGSGFYDLRNFSIAGSGTVFTATSGIMTVRQGWTHLTGTFDANGGTVEFDGAASDSMNANVSETFNNVTISKSAGFGLTIANGDTMIVEGTLNLVSGQLRSTSGTGVVEVRGDMTVQSTFNNNQLVNVGMIHITDGVSDILIPDSVLLPTIILDTPRSIIVNAGADIGFLADLTVTDGTFDGNDAAILVRDTLTINGIGAIFDSTSGTLSIRGDFHHSDGTFNANGGVVEFTTTGSHTLTGDTTFYDLYSETMTGTAEVFQLESGSTTTVTHEARFQPALVDSGRITIRSSTSAVQATLDFPGEAYVFGARMQDVAFSGAVPLRCPYRCVDLGNVTNVRFGDVGFDEVGTHGTETGEDGSSEIVTITLRGTPMDTVTLPISVSDSTEASLNTSVLTFTAGDMTESFTVTGKNDALVDGGVAYDVVLGAASSSDAEYDGYDPADFSFVNADNESDNVSQLATAADFTQEDVRMTGAAEINWFDHTGYGQGTLMTGSGGLAVDLTGSKIQTGCRVLLSGGESLTIQKIEDVANGAITVTDGTSSAPELDASLSDDTVTSILCTRFRADGVRLNDASALITRSQVDIGSPDGWWITYDSGNDAVWVTDVNLNLVYKIDVSSSTLLGSFATGSIPWDLDYAPSNDTIWVVNNADDSVTAYDAATGAYAFGTFGASTFAVGDAPQEIEYDPVHDTMWVTNAGPAAFSISELDVTDGSLVGTFSVNMRGYGLGYASDSQSLWVTGIPDTGSLFSDVVQIDSTTGLPYNGTFADSTYRIPAEGGADLTRYDSTNQVIWIATQTCSGSDRLIRMDANTGKTLGVYETGSCNYQVFVDETHNRLYNIDFDEASITAFVLDTGERVNQYPAGQCPSDMTADGDGNLWVIQCSGTVDRLIVDAVPTDEYVTVTTTSASDFAASAWVHLTSLTASETLNGQEAYYSVTFDGGETYLVHGSWRPIASDLATVTGGVDGDWYYVNDADVWNPAPGNTAEQAISLAIENGPTQNRMDGTTMNALSGSQWEETGGFNGSVTTVGFAITMASNDPTDNVSVAFIQADTVESTGEASGGTSPSSDSTAPTIYNVTVSSIGETSAVVSWNTDELADSRVDWGMDTNYEAGSQTSGNFVTSHSFTLVGLTPATTYEVRVRSSDFSANQAQATTSFVTAGTAPVPTEPTPTTPEEPRGPVPPEPPPEEIIPPEETIPTAPETTEPPTSEPTPTEPVGTPVPPPTSGTIPVPAPSPVSGGTTTPTPSGSGSGSDTTAPVTEPVEEPRETTPPTEPAPTVPSTSVESPIQDVQGIVAAVEAVRETLTPVARLTVPVVGIVAVANVGVLATAFGLPAFLQWIFTSPFILLRKKKRRTFGVVYHAFSRLPVELAIVRLYRAENHTLVASAVTDRNGRYAFFPKPGSYTIEVMKNGFAFPSGALAGVREDGPFVDVYHGEKIEVTDENAIVTANIPLDPSEAHAGSLTRIGRERFLGRAVGLLGLVGVIASAVVVFVVPSFVSVGSLLLQVAVYAMIRRLTRTKPPTGWSVVYNQQTRAPIGQAVVRIFDQRYDKLVETHVADAQGRVFTRLGPGQFRVSVEHAGFEPATVPNVDFRQSTGANELKLRIGLLPAAA